jgi:hypothetical protein
MEVENNTEMLFYLLIHAALFILSNIFTLLKSDNKIMQSPVKNKNNNIQKLESEIYTLKKEAEKHNTQSEFVTYSKILRRINVLENELQTEKNKQQINRNKYNENQENEINFFSKMINSYSSSSVFYTNILMWIITILENFILSEKNFIFNYNNYKGNILIEYYHKENENIVKIPIKIILICETIVLNQINNSIKNLF